MGFFNEYPYTNLHEVNLDYVLKEVNSLSDIVNNILEDKIDDYIDKKFNSIMIDAVYNERTETIMLKKKILSNGDMHIYSNEDKTMSIL